MKKENCLEIFERYILNKATEDEVKLLVLWIKSNKKLSQWLEEQILSSSNEMDKDVQMRMFSQIKNSIQVSDSKNITTFTKTSILNKWLRVAAMLLLPLMTAAGVYFYMSRAETSEPLIVSVERGQKASIVLPDGSKVWLNSLSKLTYTNDFNKKKRILKLDGEAYFEVAHNPEKPFIVKSKDITVEALGTSFGMEAYDEDEMVSSILMEGKVKVTTPNGITTLLPNERVLYDKTNKKAKKTNVTNAKDFTGWIHNTLRFENESLNEIAKNIQRNYNVKIIFDTERLKNLRYTGTVENNSLESVLNIITLTSPISFKVDSQCVTLYENKRLMKHYQE
jgi:ferric-dicitrate binding protein FerR (iron transport regulator)